MITIICSNNFETKLEAIGAKIVDGKWSVTSLLDTDKIALEAGGAIVEGCKYRCWGEWFSTIYQVSRDPRCTASFNTVSKRALGLVDLDKIVVGRAKTDRPTIRRGTGLGYRATFQGKEYPSEAAIAREFNVNLRRFRSRRQLGWSLEEALHE